MNRSRLAPALLALGALTFASASVAQTAPVKVGLVLPITGPFASTGRQILGGAQTYLKLNGDMAGGRRIELVVKDDAAIADQSKRVTQELIVNDKADILAGFGLTPTALAAAPLATQAKKAMIVMGGATSIVTEQSPFIVRTSYAQGQAPYVMGQWAAKNGMKTAVTIVSDFAPGYDTESAFGGAFKAEGGRVIEALRAPLASPEFTPFIQRAADAKPDALFVFIPAGQTVTLVKQLTERGLTRSGVRLIGAGDLTDDEVLGSMGDGMIGVVTAGSYSAAHETPLNEKFVATMQADFGITPNFFGVAGYDGIRAVALALEKTKGASDGPAIVNALKGASWESPRGPITIDAKTRDIVQTIYLRKVERREGKLWNVEFDKVLDVADPVKAGRLAK